MHGRAGVLRAADRDAAGFVAATADHFVLALGIGPVLRTLPTAGGWEGHLGLLLSHVHHASLRSWGDHPGANLAGDSSGDVRHRSGVEVLAGASSPRLLKLGNWGLIASAEAAFGLLPSSAELAWCGGVRLGLGLRR